MSLPTNRIKRCAGAHCKIKTFEYLFIYSRFRLTLTNLATINWEIKYCISWRVTKCYRNKIRVREVNLKQQTVTINGLHFRVVK